MANGEWRMAWRMALMSFPLALAAAIGLEPGEEVQWELLERGELHLLRPNPPTPAAKAKARQ